jgi:hypothetical protein
MRRNGIKNVLLANGTSAVIWQKKMTMAILVYRSPDDSIKTPRERSDSNEVIGKYSTIFYKSFLIW